MQRVRVLHFTDPGCPWAYSAAPAMAALRWRFGGQLDWQLVMIGLSESIDADADDGYTPHVQARGYRRFVPYGMPFQVQPKRRIAATSRACRAIVAARLQRPDLGESAFRALQLSQFTTTRVLDDDDDLRDALRDVRGLDADAVVAAIEDPDVIAAYEADRAHARTAEGSPTQWQGKATNSDGRVRYTAPSLVFEHDGTRVEAGGFQPIEAYDVVLANLRLGLERRAAPASPLPALAEAPDGLTTAEIAEVVRPGLLPADRGRTELDLIALAAEGAVVRTAVGDDAVWLAAVHAEARAAAGLAPVAGAARLTTSAT